MTWAQMYGSGYSGSLPYSSAAGALVLGVLDRHDLGRMVFLYPRPVSWAA
jgi:hypothetical protein